MVKFCGIPLDIDDVEAAARSDIAAIALRCGGSDHRALKGAIEILDPAELLGSFRSSGSRRSRAVVIVIFRIDLAHRRLARALLHFRDRDGDVVILLDAGEAAY